MRRGHTGKVDGNQSDVVDALRAAGWLVQSLSGVGGGCCDLLCYKRAERRLALVEVKEPKGKLTPAQARWLDSGWPVYVVRSAEEALEIVR